MKKITKSVNLKALDASSDDVLLDDIRALIKKRRLLMDSGLMTEKNATA